METNQITSKKSKAILLFLLLILNIVIRIPSIPHEKGLDSFFIHLLATSLSVYGGAKWWLNEYSIFGLFPYSYASSTPYSLSGISQLTNIDMESSILIYCILLGLFSMFSMYVFAGRLYNNFLFRYIAAMLFSLSQGVLLYTTWEVSGRGTFLVFSQLFPFLILKTNIYYLKRVILLSILFFFLLATHHYAYFTIPFLIVYTYLIIVKRINLKLQGEKRIICIYAIFLVAALIYPFFSGLFFDGGSRYAWVMDLFITTGRWIGPMIFFALSGFIYIFAKSKKTFEEWYILLLILFFLPLGYSEIYGKFLLIPLAALFISIAFVNVLELTVNRKKALNLFIIVILLSSFTYSSFFNHERLSSSSLYWYMSEETYSGGIWTKNYVPEGSHALADNLDIAGLNMKRMFAVSEGHFIVPTQDAVDLAYGLINGSNIEYENTSYLSQNFYFEGPYVAKKGQSLSGAHMWALDQEDINSDKIKSFLYHNNISYISEFSAQQNSRIMPSVHNTKNSIYDSGLTQIYTV